MINPRPLQMPRDFSPADGSARYVLERDHLSNVIWTYLLHRDDLPAIYLGLLERRPETDEETLAGTAMFTLMSACVFEAAGWGDIQDPSADHIGPENLEWVELMQELVGAAVRAEARIIGQRLGSNND